MKKKIFIPLVLLVIGFAAVSTTLIINGVVGVGTNQNSFIEGVVFDEDSIRKSIDNITADVSASGRTISFTTQEMTSAGEISTVYFKIKNYSQYDAKLGTPAISCYFVENHQEDTKATQIGITNDYVELLPGSNLDGITINAGGSISEETYVTVRQKKSYVEDEKQEVKFQCEINVTGGDSATPGIDKVPSYNVTFNANGGTEIATTKKVEFGEIYGELPTPTHTNSNMRFLGWHTEDGKKVESTTTVNIQEDHTLKAYWYELTTDTDNSATVTVGDKITVGTESFYVISHTNGKINALAEFNLNVGSNPVPNQTYGIQNKDARGYLESGTSYGNVKFSKQKGWYDGEESINIRNEAYRVGSGVTIETMTALDVLYTSNESAGIKGYEEYIQETIPTAKVRLITRGELEGLGCSDNTCSSSHYDWLYYSTYWLQTASSDFADDVEIVFSFGNFGSAAFDNGNNTGVRPVITISEV